MSNQQQPQQSLHGIYGLSNSNVQQFQSQSNQLNPFQQFQSNFQSPQQLSNAQVASQQSLSHLQQQQLIQTPFQQQQQQQNFPSQLMYQNANVNMYPGSIAPNAYPNYQQPSYNFVSQYNVAYGGQQQTVGGGLDKIPLDDPIQEEKGSSQMSVEQAKFDLQGDLTVNVKANQKCVRLSKEKSDKIPIMVSLKTKELQQEGQRAAVDLICVIDHSGSMSDYGKMQLAQKTLKTLMSLLNEKDRLQIIEFDDRASILTRLMFVNNQNKPEFERVIDSIRPQGGTSITEGMDLAFQSIAGRKHRNPVTSIFLLSDGLDGGAVQGVTRQLEARKLEDNFTINSFGFGQDHDPILMSSISKLKDGNFYFIQELNTLVEYFADALGGLVSVVAKDISVVVSSNCQSPLHDTKVVYAYGENWVKNDGRFTKQLQYLISGSSKDFIFELEIPKLELHIEDYQRNQEVAVAQVFATDVSTGLVLSFKQSITLTFYNEDENIPPQEEDEDLMLNYFRVKGAQHIDDARVACQQGKFKDGEQILDGFIQKIQQKPYAQKAQNLILDLETQKKVCQPQAFQAFGQIQMIQANYQQMAQFSQPQYANAGFGNQNRNQMMFQQQAKNQQF